MVVGCSLQAQWDGLAQECEGAPPWVGGRLGEGENGGAGVLVAVAQVGPGRGKDGVRRDQERPKAPNEWVPF